MDFRNKVIASYQHQPHLLGKKGEAEAARYLLTCGYEILERNWRTSSGELDIIALAKGGEAHEVRELVFIEVKTRSSLRFGDPFDAITPEKYRRVYILAREWIAIHQLRAPWRIDVILLVKNGTGFDIVHHKGLIA